MGDPSAGAPNGNGGKPAAWPGLLGTLGPLIGLAFVWGLFAVLVGEGFLRWENQRLMLLQTAVVGTAAVGATLIIVSGGIDLSVGASIALVTVVVALMLTAGWSPGAAAAGGMGAGLAVGLAIGAMVIGHVGRVAAAALGAFIAWKMWPEGAVTAGVAGAAAACLGLGVNKWLIGRVPLSPFIVTLGMFAGLRGLAEAVSDNQPVYPAGSGWLGRLMVVGESGPASWMAPGVWVFLAAAILAAAVLRYTRFGRHVFAVGSNEQTARLCGVRVERTKLLVYAFGVCCAGVAGLLEFSFLGGIGDPTDAQGLELAVIAAVVIGGASLAGGEGTILGTIAGALIMTIVANGCTLLGLANNVQKMLTGAIIVAAVTLDRLRHRRPT